MKETKKIQECQMEEGPISNAQISGLEQRDAYRGGLERHDG